MSLQEARPGRRGPSPGFSSRDLTRYRRYQPGEAGLSGARRIIVVLEASLLAAQLDQDPHEGKQWTMRGRTVTSRINKSWADCRPE
jgi:hypothetical protein